MPNRPSFLNTHERRLTRRYLIWCYKTTKEELDRIDRYFTQLTVDQIILKELRKARGAIKGDGYDREVKAFADYMTKKEARVFSEKYVDPKRTKLQPRYAYLRQRLKGIERAVKEMFDAAELKKIQKIYEEEMIRRILEAREER